MTAVYGSFHIHFMVWVLIIVEDPTVTVKYRTKKSTVLLLEFVSGRNVQSA